MGNRKLANLQFDVHFLYPDQETFVKFANALMFALHSEADYQERQFEGQRIEVVHSSEMIEIPDEEDE